MAKNENNERLVWKFKNTQFKTKWLKSELINFPQRTKEFL